MSVPTRRFTRTGAHTPLTRIRDPRILWAMRIVWLVVVFQVAISVILHTQPSYESLLAQGQTEADVIAGMAELGLSNEARAATLPIMDLVSVFAYLVVAGVIFLYRSDNWVALWLSMTLVLLPVASNGILLRLAFYYPYLSWAFAALFALTVLMMAPALFIIPDGQFYPRWSRWLLPPFIAWEMLRIYQWLIVQDRLGISDVFWNLPLFLIGVLAILAQIRRYRQGTPDYRQQLKWVLFGFVVWFVALLIALVNPDAIPGLTAGQRVILSLVMLSGVKLAGIVLAVCIGIAIIGYNLYAINVVINRSIVYGSVMAGLAVLFLVGAILLQNILGAGNGVLAFGIAAVAAGLLFNPVRRRVQNVIDRRFYGFRFDLDELEEAHQPPQIANPGMFTGQTMGGYELLGVLGKGGMGEVYQGRDSRGQRAAIKVLPPNLTNNDEYRKRFERETRTTDELQHPNIITSFGAGVSNGIYYMAMELIEGQELRDIIKQQAPLDLATTREILAGVCAALDYAHARGFVHRDIKPSNVMLRLREDNETYQPVLMDFGVSKIKDTQSSLTGANAIGTIDYMAPEQIMAVTEVDARADIYALGVMLYEMLTGELPFKGSPTQVLFAHVQQPAPDPRFVNPDIPDSVAMAIHTAMEKTPENRFVSASALLRALM